MADREEFDFAALTVPEDPSPLFDLEAAADGIDIGTGTCSSGGCANPIFGQADTCTECVAMAMVTRESSPSPRVVTSESGAIEDLLAGADALMGSVPDTEEGGLQRSVSRLQQWLEDNHLPPLPLRAPRLIEAYAMQLVKKRGLPIPGRGEPMPSIEREHRIVEETYLREWRHIDKWHLRYRYDPPWDAFKRTLHGEILWTRLQSAYLKPDAGAAAHALELDHLWWMMLALDEPFPNKKHDAALMAITTCPSVQVDDGSRLYAPMIAGIGPGDVQWGRAASKTGLRPLEIVRSSYKKDRTIIVPDHYRQLVLDVYEYRYGAEIGTNPDTLPNEPLFQPQGGGVFSKNGVEEGVKSRVETAIKEKTDAGLGCFATQSMFDGRLGQNLDVDPDIRLAAVKELVDWNLRVPDEHVQAAAWLPNAFFTLARGLEVLQRTGEELAFAQSGPLWFLPRKNHKTGERTPYAAPHMRWGPLDPSVRLKRYLKVLKRRRQEQGVTTPWEDQQLFPTNLDDVSFTAVNKISHFNEVIKRVQQATPQVPSYLRLTTHSPRSGFVTTARLLGVSDASIMQAGGWRDVNVFHSYFAAIRPTSAASAANLMVASFDPKAVRDAGITGRLLSIIELVERSKGYVDQMCTCNLCVTGAYDEPGIDAVLVAKR